MRRDREGGNAIEIEHRSASHPRPRFVAVAWHSSHRVRQDESSLGARIRKRVDCEDELFPRAGWVGRRLVLDLDLDSNAVLG